MHDLDKPARKTIIKRGLQMLVLGLFVNLALSMVALLAFIQFLWMLVKQERNHPISRAGKYFNQWLGETVDFLLADSEEKPFPWKWFLDSSQKPED